MQFKWIPQVIDLIEDGQLRIEVLEYHAHPLEEPLPGFHQPIARPMAFRQVTLHLNAGSAILEPGALQWLRGNIELSASGNPGGGGGLGGLLRGAAMAMASGEGMFKTVYNGRGVICTEPTRHFFLLGQLRGEDLICDDGTFVASMGQTSVSQHVNNSLSGMLGSGEGLVQPKISGQGLYVLQSPVHPDEVQKITLNNETLKVDGNLVLAYTSGLTMTVERSSRGMMNSAKTGEGYLQVYRGSGTLLLAPTLHSS